MTITLISKRDYNKLCSRQIKYSALTFNNKGYEYLDKSKFSKEDKKAFDEISNILSKSIKGFSKFNNFKVRENGDICIRFQYNYNADSDIPQPSFIGVGYLKILELYKGF